MPDVIPKISPYHVRTTDGTFHSGYDGPQQAQSAAHRANEEAERLGIQTRYVVKARDAA